VIPFVRAVRAKSRARMARSGLCLSVVDAVSRQLRSYLGVPDHRARMASFGFTRNEIDPALAGHSPEVPNIF
jgi:hypothetical protein